MTLPVVRKPETQRSFVERKHDFPGMELIVQEFVFHQLNANLLWPGTFAFAEWLVQNRPLIQGWHCIELGRYFSMLGHPFVSGIFHPLAWHGQDYLHTTFTSLLL